MTILRRCLTVLAAILIAQGPASAISGRTGMEGAQFLRLGAGARAAALGEAFSAAACGPEALYWNPAGLACLEVPEAAASHAEYLGTFRYETLYAASPSAGLNGTLGMGLSYMTQDSIEAFDNTGAATGESFRPGAMFFSAGYARKIKLERLSLNAGAAAIWLRESLWNYSASAFAFDLGLQAVHDGAPGWRAGAALRHLGSRQKFISQTASLPAELDIGLSYDPADIWKGWTISAEAAVPYYAAAYAKLGLERRIALGREAMLAARGGFNTRTLSSLGAGSAFSFGFGLYLKRASWDFSFNNQGDIGSVYRFGFGWHFGQGSLREKPVSAAEPANPPLPSTPVSPVEPTNPSLPSTPVQPVEPVNQLPPVAPSLQ